MPDGVHRIGEGETAAGISETDGLQDAALLGSGLFDGAWYAATYPDAAAAPDPLRHFCDHGWRCGFRPNPYFDPAWYLAQNPEVREAGANPVLHYLFDGEADGRAPVPYFDPAWYRRAHAVPAGTLCLAHFLEHRRSGTVSPTAEFDVAHYLNAYPDVAAAGIDPFEHYLFHGFTEDRNPSPWFDTRWYRRRYLAGQPEANPLLHYLAHRGEPGIHPAEPPDAATIPREVRRTTAPGPHFEERLPLPPAMPKRAKVLAYYLPQFHAIPENDAWWGRGFTEWANVARGLPRFAGHYQPRIPRDLGPYTLEGTEVLRRQVAMAREGGLHGFVFYFYWFNGRRLLERPVESFLAAGDIDFPFCLMWANENWTRRWDGSENHVLMSQDYREEDEAALLATFARHFADPRYIRVQGRPLLMVYRAGLIPDAPATVARWRQAFRDAHGEDPVFVMGQAFDAHDPREFGMDGAIEFPPHKLVHGLPLMNQGLNVLDPAFSAQVYDYDDVVAASLAEPAPDFPLIKTAVPSWDNDARRQGAGLVLHGSTPARYEAWLSGLIRNAARAPFLGEHLVCVNAWNEWAEGAYLEPDQHFGGAYLNATARAVAAGAAAAEAGKLLLVGHDAFPAGAQHLLLHLGRQLARAHGVEIAFLLRGGGRMEARYADVAPVAIAADEDAVRMRARELRARGFAAAIVNTAAAAGLVPVLEECGIACTLLLHELPGILREKHLIEPARHGAEAARQVVFAAAAVRDRFLAATGAAPARTTLLPQGAYSPVRFDPQRRAALRAALGVPEDAILAVGMGYADLRKGFDLFLQAWRAAQAMAAEAGEGGGRGRDVHFCWLGEMDPTLRGHLGAEVAAAEATGRFHVPGWRDDAPEWFSAADIHLLTSREDPFPSVVLEAMHAGLPSVAFIGSGGIPEVLAELGAGAAVPLGDAFGMARAMLRLARPSPEERARLGAAAASRFDFPRYAAGLLALTHPGMPAISVVVPNRDYGRYLGERLGSIFAQTHPVREVILIDDASVDDSLAVAASVIAEAGREVRVVTSAAPTGSVFRAWQRAAREARGEWLWIAEADDRAEPEFLERLAAALRGAPDAVLAFTDSRAIDEGGDTLWDDHKAYYAEAGPGTLEADGVFAARDFLRLCLAERNLILNASSVLWRRDALLAAFDRCGEALGALTVAGDWRLYVEVLDQERAQVAYVAQPLNHHRRHAASVTGRLDPESHMEEIAGIHRVVAERLAIGPALAERQAALRTRIAAGMRGRQRRRGEARQAAG